MPIPPAFAVSVPPQRVIQGVVAPPRDRGLRGAGVVGGRAVRICEQGRDTGHDVPGVAAIVRPKQVADAGPKVRCGRNDDPRVARVGQHDGWAGEGPDGALLRGELGDRVRAAIDALPEPYRTTVLLSDVDEMSMEEIAATMSVTVPAVKSRLHRGRLALRKALEPYLKK